MGGIDRWRASRGVTLIETVVAMGVAGVLMAIAVPSFNFVTTSNRISSEINALLGDLQYARAEAIRQGLTVVACISDGLPAPSCATGNTNAWQAGWLIFADLNNDGTFDGGDVLLRVQGKFSGTDDFSDNGFTGVKFNREGFATGVPSWPAAPPLITLHATPAVTTSTRCLAITTIGSMSTEVYGDAKNGATCT